MQALFFIAISFGIVAFGQAAWVREFGPLAAAFGYALFWKGMLHWKRPSQRFWLAWGWFAAVQAIQLSWMTTTDYMGLCILIVYAGLIFFMGAQFAFLSARIDESPVCFLRCMAFSGVWVLCEWMRLFISAGLTWNPAGMALSCCGWSLQAASLFGIYGLSFWTIFVNLTAFRAMQAKTALSVAAWAVCAISPYFFGIAQQAIFSRESLNISAVLVQTAIRPEEKDRLFGGRDAIDPMDQWDRIVRLIERVKPKKIDLIVLPEGALPIEASRPVYRLSEIEDLWQANFGGGFERDAPKIKFLKDEDFRRSIVSNSFVAQALANHYESELIVGFDRICLQTGKCFNSAFHFLPRHSGGLSFYDKQVLVPMGEYIPLSRLTFISNLLSSWFDLGLSFEAGVKAGVFFGKVPFGMTICYEETYGNLVSRARRLGAKMFVNISNDVWFPKSKLAQQHFDHGIIRGVENGVSVLRACNTGITGGVDCFGRVIARLAPEKAGALAIEIPQATFPTLYSLWGDWAILAVGFASVVYLLGSKRID